MAAIIQMLAGAPLGLFMTTAGFFKCTGIGAMGAEMQGGFDNYGPFFGIAKTPLLYAVGVTEAAAGPIILASLLGFAQGGKVILAGTACCSIMVNCMCAHIGLRDPQEKVVFSLVITALSFAYTFASAFVSAKAKTE